MIIVSAIWVERKLYSLLLSLLSGSKERALIRYFSVAAYRGVMCSIIKTFFSLFFRIIVAIFFLLYKKARQIKT